LYYGVLKVLEGSSLSLEGSVVDLMGGSSKYPWASEESTISSECSLKVDQFEDFMIELFLGKAPTANSAETTGSTTTLTNVYGTSAKSATIGIASVSALSASESDMKFGQYIVKVVSATTVDVYFSSDLDLGRGTNGTYQNDALKITATALTIASGAPVTVPNFGIKLTGGSGTIGMTTGDTASFSVRPPNTKSMDVSIGGLSDATFPEFGAIIMAQKRGNGEMFELTAYKCKGVGMPFPFEMGAFSKTEIKVKCLYDSAVDAVFSARHITPSVV